MQAHGAAAPPVAPNPLFSDHAVLQRDKKVPVWGTAAEGEKVTVQFAGQKLETVAREGRWKVELQPMPASAQPRTMTITGNNTITISNLLVGEVWLCSGQSNMEWPLIKSINGPEAIAASADPQLRILRVDRRPSDAPLAAVTAKWNECSPASVPDFSAVAYHSGRDLRKTLKVPVGLIGSYFGGSLAESWVDRKTLAGDPELKTILEEQERKVAEFDPAQMAVANSRIRAEFEAANAKSIADGKPKPRGPNYYMDPKQWWRRPASLYNGMIAPLQPYALRGVLWYQGEANTDKPFLYRTLFPAMIASWRRQWNQGDFPFLFVQIAPHKAMGPGIREAQLLTWKSTPHTAMVVTTDLGDAYNIHPRDKQPVGQRLALAARALAYGEKIEYSGPEFDSMSVRGNRAVIHFKHTGGGLVARKGDLRGFFIAGADGNFWPARAEIKGVTVEVFNDQVPAPAAVRYGWATVPDVNLANKEGLPASPFRTDVSDSYVFRIDFPAAGAVDLLAGQGAGGLVHLDHGARWIAGGVEVNTLNAPPDKGLSYLVTVPANVGFEPGQRYRISYEYKAKAARMCDPAGLYLAELPWAFYHSFEGGAPDGRSPGFREVWEAEFGCPGQKEFIVTVTRPDARLILGVKNGAIHIGKLTVKKLGQ